MYSIILFFTSQTAENETEVDVLSDVAMHNAYLICHNVQVFTTRLFPPAV